MAEQIIDFREARAADATDFLTFMAQVAQETDYLVMDEDGLPLTESQMSDILERSYLAPDQLTLLALAGDEVIGAISIRTPRQTKLNHIGDVFLAVKKTYWGHGIGRLLLEESIDWAQQEGLLARLELTVQARNSSAIALYKKVGFELEGTKKRGARSATGDFLDVHLMAKLIG